MKRNLHSKAAAIVLLLLSMTAQCRAEGLPDTIEASSVAPADARQLTVPGEIIPLPESDAPIYDDWQEFARNNHLVGKKDRLIQLNGCYVKGRDSRFFKFIMDRPEGEPLNFVSLSMATGDLIFQRLEPSLKPFSSKRIFGTMIGVSDMFDRPLRFSDGAKAQAKYCHAGGADLYAAAVYRDLVNGQPYTHAGPYDDRMIEAFPEAIQFFDETGFFTQSDWAVEKAIERVKNMNYVPLRVKAFKALLSTAKYLRETDRTAQATAIEDALFVISDQARDRETTVLKYFEPTWRGEDCSDKRFALYAKFEKLCAATRYQNPDDLEFLARGYYNCRKFAKAEMLFQKLVAAREKDIPFLGRNGSSATTVLSDFAPILRAYVALSDCEIILGKTDFALKHLNAAMKIIGTKCNTEEIVRLERFSTPCMSDIKVAIARVYQMKGERSYAKKLLEDAITQIEAALGVDSPQLKAPLMVLSQTYSMSDKKKARLMESRAVSLPKPNRDFSTIDKFVDWKKARDVYDLIRSKDFAKADELFAELVAQEQQNQQHRASDICRLINLAKVYSEHGSKDHAFAALAEIEKLTDHIYLHATRLYVLGELALLCEDLELDAASAWQRFDDQSKQMQSISFPNLSGQSRSRDRLQEDLIQRANAHAVVYVFSGEPAKAVRLLERLLKQCDDPGGLGNPVVLSQLALAQLESGDIHASTKTFQRGISASPILYDNMQKFAQIANGFQLKNHGAEAVALLKELTLRLKQSEHFRAAITPVALERARIEMSLGNYKEAEETLQEANVKDWDSNHWQVISEIGRALELQEKTDESINVYCAAAAMNELRGSPLGYRTVQRLFNLLWKKRDVSTEKIEDAVDLANELYGTMDVEFWQETAGFAIGHHVFGERMMKPQLKIVQYHEDHDEINDAMRLMRAVANEAERISSPEETNYWLRVADLEVRSKQFENAANTVLDHLCGLSNLYPQKRRLQFSALYSAGQFQKLRRILRQNLEKHEAGPEQSTIEAKRLLAVFLIKQGQFVEAQEFENDIVSYYESQSGSASKIRDQLHWRRLSDDLLDISDAYLERNQTSSAMKFAKLLYALQKKSIGPMNPMLVATLEQLGRIYDAENNQRARGRVLREALEIAKYTSGNRTLKTASVKIALADLLRKEGRIAEAELMALNSPVYVTGQNIKLIYGPTAGDTGHGLLPTTFADTAEQPLKDSLKENEVAYGPGSPEAIAVIDQLIKFYGDRGDKIAASEFQKIKLERMAAIGPEQTRRNE